MSYIEKILNRSGYIKKSRCFNEVFEDIRNDEGLYIAWKSNIAMAFYDEARRSNSRDSRKKLHEISNRAADNFLQLLLKKVG
jgi:hypothetical protein